MHLKRINLLDESAFATAGGLWTGKKGPFVTATVIRNTNFTASGRVDYSDVAMLQVEEKQLASRRLLPGDIIIERSGGGPSQPVGRVVFFDRDNGIFSHSNFTSRLRVLDTNRFTPLFVFYFLLYFHDSGQTDHLQRRTTGIRNLDWKAYRENAGVPLFDFDEQRQVAAVLSAVQRAILRQERLIALTTEFKKALMHRLFTEGIRREPLKQTEIGRVPKSWDVVDLGSCCKLATGTTPATAEPAYYRGNNAFIKTDQIINARIASANLFISDEALAHYGLKVYPPGTLLMAMYGQGKTRGQVGILDIPASITQNAAALVCGDGLIPDFLYFYLMSQYARLRESGFDGQISHLNLGFLRRLLIPRPQPVEQMRIGEALTLVEAKEERHRRMSLSLNDLFGSLLHQLMTTQIRVRDLDLSALKEAAQPAGAA